MNDEDKQKDSIGNKLKQAGKEEAKKQIKDKVKKLLIKAMPFIATVLIAMILASCLMAIANIAIEAIQGIGNVIVGFFTGSQTAIQLDDSQIDELIRQIEATGIDLEDLELLRRNQL